MNNSPVIVLGLGPAGLFLVRQLAHITDNIYAVGRPDDVGMYSRYVRKEKRHYAVTSEELEKVFLKIRAGETQKPILYICSDQYLSILIEQQGKWEQMVDLAGTGFDTLQLINDKNTINAYCVNHGVRIPESISYGEFRNHRNYPVIIKWVEKRIETAVNPIGKVKVCRSDAEFEAVDKAVRDGGIGDDELFVQTYIEGKNDCQYSIGGYYKDGEALADVVVNQVKQEPQGISAEVVTVEVPVCNDLRRITREFAKELSYSGFLEMEYKVDAVTQEIYLLDVNPRPWGWVSILGTVYTDFYRVLEGKRPGAESQSALWKSPMRVLMGKSNSQNVEPNANSKSYKKAYDIKESSDLRPSIMIYIMAVKKIMRRIKR